MKSAQEWLQDPELFGTAGCALLADRFGVSFLNWDPATVALEFRDEFGFEASQGLQDRIQAASCVLVTDLFYVSAEGFSAVCNALNFGAVSSEVMVPADLDDVLWGVSEAMLLLGESFDLKRFGHNVARYVGVLLALGGVTQPPSVLGFAEYPDNLVLPDPSGMSQDVEFMRAKMLSEKEARDNLEEVNRAQLMRYFAQLSQLPLVHGSTEVLRKGLEKEGGL
jgi:hypothetical protein